MDEKYLKIRKQLSYLGYTQNFPSDSLPLVENLISDLLQTTSSLKHYMNVCKEAIHQKDELQGAAEPYKCDNAKLIKENNQLHLSLMKYKEDAANKNFTVKSSVERLEREISGLKRQNESLQSQIRDYKLKNVCADTVSSSKKSVFSCKNQSDTARSKINSNESSVCPICSELKSELSQTVQKLSDVKIEKSELRNRIALVQNQLDHRASEIRRLNSLLEGGRPLSALKKECCCLNDDEKYAEMHEYVQNMEDENANLNAQLKESLAKQHEAMSRAVQLVEECRHLQEKKETAENLALKLETDCNRELKEKFDMINELQNQLQNGYSDRQLPDIEDISSYIDSLTKMNENLQTENKKLVAAIRRLEEKSKGQPSSESAVLSYCEKCGKIKISNLKDANENVAKDSGNTYCKCMNFSKESLMELIEKERKFYESHINEIKSKLNSRQNQKEKSVEQLKNERDFYMSEYQALKNKSASDEFVVELQNKICNLEQRVFCLEKDNKILVDKNSELKVKIGDALSQRQKERYNYEVPHTQRTEAILEHLEKDLQKAREDINKVENERDVMQAKLEAALHYNQLSAREESRLRESRSSNSILITSQNARLQQECDGLRENLRVSESELLHMKTLYNQLKSLQSETDRNISDVQEKLNNSKKEIVMLKNTMEAKDKLKSDLEYELKILKADKLNLKDNLIDIDKERDKLVMDVDEKTEKISSLQHNLRSKDTTIELLENRVTELNRKLELLTNANSTLEHKLQDAQAGSESLSLELDMVTKQRDNILIENRRLQSDLAAVTNDLRSIKREYDISRKEVEEMKQQLQHYVDEVRRIEDILSRKEAERTEMLDHFASLSHEATVLESNNHSLETEAATKHIQLQAVEEKVVDLERRLKSRESIIEMQEEKIASLMYEISTLESELNKQREAAKASEQMLIHAQEMCSIIQNQKKTMIKGVSNASSERKSLEYNLEIANKDKRRLEESSSKDKITIESLEELLADSRRVVVDLKLSLQESTEETRRLHKKMENLQKQLDILQNESESSRQCNEEAAKQLQDLQLQMTDERYHRVTTQSKLLSSERTDSPN